MCGLRVEDWREGGREKEAQDKSMNLFLIKEKKKEDLDFIDLCLKSK